MYSVTVKTVMKLPSEFLIVMKRLQFSTVQICTIHIYICDIHTIIDFSQILVGSATGLVQSRLLTEMSTLGGLETAGRFYGSMTCYFEPHGIKLVR